MDKWVRDVPEKLELGHGVQTAGASRVPWDEDQLAVLDTFPAPAKKIGRLGWAIVLIGAEERHVEAITRIVEVVRIAAECGDAIFGREDQTNVRVLLVPVKMVRPSRIQR